MNIQIKRVYDDAKKNDGFRVLIDRLWPRGITKERADIKLWLKDLAPSNELRKWLHQDPDKNYKEFTKKYKEELKTKKAEIKEIKLELAKKKKVTLVTAVKDLNHSQVMTVYNLLKVTN